MFVTIFRGFQPLFALVHVEPIVGSRALERSVGFGGQVRFIRRTGSPNVCPLRRFGFKLAVAQKAPELTPTPQDVVVSFAQCGVERPVRFGFWPE